MKTKKAKGRASSRVDRKLQRVQLIAKAAAAEKLAEAARQHWRTLKTEQKQARKAFKQARKAAKLALKEASVGIKALKAFEKKMAKAEKVSAGKRKTVVSRGQVVRGGPSRKSGSDFKPQVDAPSPLGSIGTSNL